MTLQCLSVPEDRWTHTAGERPLACVGTQVLLQSHPLGKSLFANTACMGSLTGVREHMPAKVRALRKTPTAHFTRVWLFTRVGALVNVKVVNGGKLLWAHGARIRFFTGVCPQVYLEHSLAA